MGIPQSISQEDDEFSTSSSCRAAELHSYRPQDYTLRNPSISGKSNRSNHSNSNNHRSSSPNTLPYNLSEKSSKEATERVRDKLFNASSKWLSNAKCLSPTSPSTTEISSQQQFSRKKLLNGVTSILHIRRRAASSPEERDKLISTLASFLSVRDGMLKSYLASDWMSTVSIIERMLVPSEFTQFIELAVQEIDDHFDFSESGDSKSTDSNGSQKNRKRRGGILSSVSHHQHRRQPIKKPHPMVSNANSSKIVNLKLMIVPPLKYHTLVEACFPVVETFLLDPMEMTNCSFGVALVVDHWFLYFEPETNLIIPKKLFSRAKDFVEQQIPTFLRVQQKVNQIENLLAACICKWNSSMYYQAAKMEFDSENSQSNQLLQPFHSETTCSSPTLLIPSSTSCSNLISSPSSMKYYGNSLDFVEDFFMNYLKYDYTKVPTFNYLRSMMTNIREMGSSELMMDLNEDLEQVISKSHILDVKQKHTMDVTTLESNHDNDGSSSNQTRSKNVVTFLDHSDLELFMDKLSISMQEQQEVFQHLQDVSSSCAPQNGAENELTASNNPFVALEILMAAFDIQYLEEGLSEKRFDQFLQGVLILWLRSIIIKEMVPSSMFAFLQKFGSKWKNSTLMKKKNNMSSSDSSPQQQPHNYFPDQQKRQHYLKTHYTDRNKPIPICTKCNSQEFVVPCARGKPAASLLQDAHDGYVHLTGCCHSADGYCVKCRHVINFK
ncbi:hypothetical protein C9374_013557 [Naegleria lovaniensis]|uniref:Uncharacterized protein n=1 Tax=Naegleria lovaniensis TaxID=51637 RepID=A0AA88H2M9_NAELO|nr:uncharacterized protein C9374_013557 [Naegleria lovaniensis]KAG2392072.1 hypothetical protein C9374_013557 [Naegleria lovaniensis]